MKHPDQCVFCKIINGQMEGFVVDEDEHTLTFLDKRPLFYGHCLLVPKQHVVTLMDLPDDEVAALFLKAKSLSQRVMAAMGAQGIFNAINNTVSQSVPHLHVHIVPRTKGDGLKGFFGPGKNTGVRITWKKLENA